MLCPVSIDTLELTEVGFFTDVGALLTLVAPGAIWFLLWRMYVTNRSGPRGDITVLGLGDSAPYLDCERAYVPAPVRLSYCLVSVVTFLVGFLTSEGFKFLRQIFLTTQQ
jgi:hypothetical protein